jgi:hypothetical protein
LTKNEWTDGKLADYPAEHDPNTHVTAGIQEVFNINSERLNETLTEEREENQDRNKEA